MRVVGSALIGLLLRGAPHFAAEAGASNQTQGGILYGSLDL